LDNLACLCQATGRSTEGWDLATRSMEIGQGNLHDTFAFSSEATMRAHLESIRWTLPVFLSHGLQQAGPTDRCATIALPWARRRKGVLLGTVWRFRRAEREMGNNPALGRKAARWRFLRQQLADLPLKVGDPKVLERQIQAWQTEADQLEADLHRALSEQRGG